jgi:hypothetical protein
LRNDIVSGGVSRAAQAAAIAATHAARTAEISAFTES